METLTDNSVPVLSEEVTSYYKRLESHRTDLEACLGFLTEYRKELVGVKEWISATLFNSVYIFSDSLNSQQETKFLDNAIAWMDSLYTSYANGSKTISGTS